MPLICGRIIAFALKHMAQVTTTIRAYDLCALHAQSVIGMACYRSWDVIEVCWPPAARLELLLRRIQRRVAGGAGIDASVRHVLVKLAGIGSFGTLLSEDSELLCWRVKRGSGIGELLEHTFGEHRSPLVIRLLKGVRHLLGGTRAEQAG